MKRYYSCGKLLLSAEYSVLRGARALSVPTLLGQQMVVYQNMTDSFLRWEAYNKEDKIWLWAEFDANLEPLYSSNADSAEFLGRLLKGAFAQTEKPSANTLVRTHLQFNSNWGLGSSSTLVHLLAQWSGCDPMNLYFKTLEGSGYDVATAIADAPILYRLEPNSAATWNSAKTPAVFEDTHFVYLGQKQDSQKEVARFKDRMTQHNQIERISALSEAFLEVKSTLQLEELISEHENITAELIGQPPIKDQKFADFPGQVKSLGAWGGDFAWVTHLEKSPNYFRERGFQVCLPYRRLIS